MTWMRHFDQCQRPFPDRLTEQIGNTVLGHDPMHVRTRYPHSFASFQHRLDPGGAIVGCGCDADYGFTARRACRTSHEGCLRREAAIEPAFKLVYADLARQVERESLRDGDHTSVGSQLLRIADLIDWQNGELRIVVHQVV